MMKNNVGGLAAGEDTDAKQQQPQRVGRLAKDKAKVAMTAAVEVEMKGENQDMDGMDEDEDENMEAAPREKTKAVGTIKAADLAKAMLPKSQLIKPRNKLYRVKAKLVLKFISDAVASSLLDLLGVSTMVKFLSTCRDTWESEQPWHIILTELGVHAGSFREMAKKHAPKIADAHPRSLVNYCFGTLGMLCSGCHVKCWEGYLTTASRYPNTRYQNHQGITKNSKRVCQECHTNFFADFPLVHPVAGDHEDLDYQRLSCEFRAKHFETCFDDNAARDGYHLYAKDRNGATSVEKLRKLAYKLFGGDIMGVSMVLEGRLDAKEKRQQEARDTKDDAIRKRCATVDSWLEENEMNPLLRDFKICKIYFSDYNTHISFGNWGDGANAGFDGETDHLSKLKIALQQISFFLSASKEKVSKHRLKQNWTIDERTNALSNLYKTGYRKAPGWVEGEAQQRQIVVLKRNHIKACPGLLDIALFANLSSEQEFVRASHKAEHTRLSQEYHATLPWWRQHWDRTDTGKQWLAEKMAEKMSPFIDPNVKAAKKQKKKKPAARRQARRAADDEDDDDDEA